MSTRTCVLLSPANGDYCGQTECIVDDVHHAFAAPRALPIDYRCAPRQSVLARVCVLCYLHSVRPSQFHALLCHHSLLFVLAQRAVCWFRTTSALRLHVHGLHQMAATWEQVCALWAWFDWSLAHHAVTLLCGALCAPARVNEQQWQLLMKLLGIMQELRAALCRHHGIVPEAHASDNALAQCETFPALDAVATLACELQTLDAVACGDVDVDYAVLAVGLSIVNSASECVVWRTTSANSGMYAADPTKKTYHSLGGLADERHFQLTLSPLALCLPLRLRDDAVRAVLSVTGRAVVVADDNPSYLMQAFGRLSISLSSAELAQTLELVGVESVWLVSIGEKWCVQLFRERILPHVLPAINVLDVAHQIATTDDVLTLFGVESMPKG